MSVWVFLGPSLPPVEAKALLPTAHFLPPAAMGDVYQLVATRKPSVIALIDGFFEQRPAVWHKELLFALASGVRVLGASSMGALRAAELCAFGMEGVGRIFEAYRDGVLEDDDEVTVVHGPAEDGYVPLSDAMVNLRDGLRLAEQAGDISARTRTLLEQAAKGLHYPERSWPALWSEGLGEALAIPGAERARLRAFVLAHRPNLKRSDAVALLQRLAEGLPALAPAPGFHFEQTRFWHKLVRSTSPEQLALPDAPSADVDAAALWRGVRVRPEGEELLRSTVLLQLLELEAAARGLAVSEQEVAAAGERFRRARGLVSAQATRRWLEENQLSGAGLREVLRFEVLFDKVQAALRGEGRLAQLLSQELKRRGTFGRTLAHLRERPAPAAEEPGARERRLARALETYQRQVRTVGGSVELHARELGFESGEALLEELLREYGGANG